MVSIQFGCNLEARHCSLYVPTCSGRLPCSSSFCTFPPNACNRLIVYRVHCASSCAIFLSVPPPLSLSLANSCSVLLRPVFLFPVPVPCFLVHQQKHSLIRLHRAHTRTHTQRETSTRADTHSGCFWWSSSRQARWCINHERSPRHHHHQTEQQCRLPPPPNCQRHRSPVGHVLGPKSDEAIPAYKKSSSTRP